MTPKLPPAFLSVPLAHRALHDVSDGRPENSRAAVRAAIEAGYGIEIDIQQSKDAQAMVFHDYRLTRLTEAEGETIGIAAAELAQKPLRGGDEGIPTLPEILQLVDGRVPLLIEVKSHDKNLGPDVGPLEESVARALEGYGGPVAVMSFNPHSVRHLAELCPDIPRGLVTEYYDPQECGLPPEICAHHNAIAAYDEVGCSFISHDWRDLRRPRVSELKSQGANILCWTVKSPTDEAEARKIAQNITFEQYLAPFPS